MEGDMVSKAKRKRHDQIRSLADALLRMEKSAVLTRRLQCWAPLHHGKGIWLVKIDVSVDFSSCRLVSVATPTAILLQAV